MIHAKAIVRDCSKTVFRIKNIKHQNSARALQIRAFMIARLDTNADPSKAKRLKLSGFVVKNH
jgi:hypothetical protein